MVPLSVPNRRRDIPSRSPVAGRSQDEAGTACASHSVQVGERSSAPTSPARRRVAAVRTAFSVSSAGSCLVLVPLSEPTADVLEERVRTPGPVRLAASADDDPSACVPESVRGRDADAVTNRTSSRTFRISDKSVASDSALRRVRFYGVSGGDITGVASPAAGDDSTSKLGHAAAGALEFRHPPACGWDNGHIRLVSPLTRFQCCC